MGSLNENRFKMILFYVGEGKDDYKGRMLHALEV